MSWDSRLPVLAGAAAGLAAAVVLTLLQSSTYRADASIALARQGQPPGDDPALARAAEAAVELFRSRAVAEPAIANLRLEESADELLDRIDIESRPDSSLVRVEVDAPSKGEARRTAQEVTELATVLFNDRFGPETVASIWETARAADDPVSPKPARNLALGTLAGALLGQLLQLWRRRARVVVAEPPSPEPIPAPGGDLEPVPETVPEPEPEPELEPEPEPVLELEPEPVPVRPFAEPRLGEWTLRDVELLLAEHGPAFPERLEELGFYLESFRGVAESDGRLPGGVEAIVEDVFGPLISRARSTSAA